MRIIPAYRSQIGAGSGGGTGGSDPFLPEYGANLIWVTGLTYEVVPIQSTIQYYIQGTLYSSTGGQGTSATADATNDRFDAYVLDTNGNVVVIEGTPAANPVLPAIDPTQYALVAYVRISAASTSAGDDGDVDQTCIYQENAEWTTSSTTPTDVDFDATTDPQNGTKHIQVNCDISGWKTMQFDISSGSINRNDVSVLKWAVRSATGGNDTSGRFFLILYNNGTPVAYQFINHAQFGWDQNDTSYHNVALDVNDDLVWLSPSYQEFDRVYLYLYDVFDRTPNSYYIDDICFQYVGNGLNTADCCGHNYENTLWVDADNGNDATAVKGDFNKPYKNASAADTAAVSGDTVELMPGTHTATGLGKDGVTYKIMAGAVLQSTSGALFTDGGSAISFNIISEGTLQNTTSGGQVITQTAASTINVLTDILDLNDTNDTDQIRAHGGANSLLRITANTINASGFRGIACEGNNTHTPKIIVRANYINCQSELFQCVDGGIMDIEFNRADVDGIRLFCYNGGGTVRMRGNVNGASTWTNGVLQVEANNIGTGGNWGETIFTGNVVHNSSKSPFDVQETGRLILRNVRCEWNDVSATQPILEMDSFGTAGDANSTAILDNVTLINHNQDAASQGINIGNNSPAGYSNIDLSNVHIQLDDTAITAGAKTIDANGASINYRIFGYLHTNAPIDGTNIAEYTMGTPEYDNGNSSTALTINLLKSNAHKVTLTGNCTFTLSNPQAGHTYVLRLVQDGTGSRTVTWPAAVKWEGGTAPTLSTAASAIDLVTLYYDGTNYYGVSALDFS